MTVSTSTHKKVLVRHRTPPAPSAFTAGFLEPGPLASQPEFHLLSPQGQAILIPRAAVQAIYFVNDFCSPATVSATAVSGRGAARLPGFRVRVRVRDPLPLEGILTTSLLDLDAGLSLSPLHAGCAWQHIFIPREAIERLEPVMVVRPDRARRRPPGPAPALGQFPLFEPQPAGGQSGPAQLNRALPLTNEDHE